jgi:hypothetical protein
MPGEKVLKDRRSPRRRGRTGTGVKTLERALRCVPSTTIVDNASTIPLRVSLI